MTPRSQPLPLEEHRAAVLRYLRGIGPQLESVAGEIIEERTLPDDQRDLARPVLVLWACAAAGGDLRDALPVAAAFELFDRFMLLHDELVEARSPTVARWGLGQSLNAGDALYALAMRALALDVRDPQRRLRAAALVGRAVLQAIEGRNIDVSRSARGERDGLFAQVRSLRRRVFTLTGSALRAGAIVAGADAQRTRAFGRAGRLIAAAGAVRDASLSARLSAKAIAVVARAIDNPALVEAFSYAAEDAARRIG